MEFTVPVNQILQGDCISILSSLPDGIVDMIFADPPYYLQLHKPLWRPNLKKVNAVDAEWDKFINFEDYDNFTSSWLSACKRVLKETGTLWVIGTYHNIFRIGKILQDLGYWILNDVIWVKNNPMPNFHGVRFTNAHETLIWAQKKKGAKYTFNHNSMKHLNDDLQMRSDWYMPICKGNERFKVNGIKSHATQKPESLLYRLTLASTNLDDLILDPFFGTGTSGAVAKTLGRNFIGIEQNQQYIDLAETRIANVARSSEMSLDIQIPRSRFRIPFGRLIEEGLIKPGQILLFKNDEIHSAVVLTDGHLRYRNQTGSIHSIAKLILNGAPANGWDLWLFEKEGGKYPISKLREIILLNEGNNEKSNKK
jgi:site-specific DNA-methyltransferase (adenine-specific)